MLLSALHAWLSITIAADQIISGVIINVAALGLTGYLNRLLISPNPRLGAGTFSTVPPSARGRRLPGRRLAARDVPRTGTDRDVGHRLRARAPGPPLPVALGASDAGRGRASARRGDRRHRRHPAALPERDHRGLFAGLAGAYLTLEGTGSFQNGMTAGRGFIALAAVIFGRWTPIGAFGARSCSPTRARSARLSASAHPATSIRSWA